ncbi:hypothetical protein Dimus_023327 [Dionaea muscipula]
MERNRRVITKVERSLAADLLRAMGDVVPISDSGVVGGIEHAPDFSLTLVEDEVGSRGGAAWGSRGVVESDGVAVSGADIDWGLAGEDEDEAVEKYEPHY